MTNALPPVRPVDGRRLVEPRVNARQCRQVNDRSPAGFLPQVGKNDHRAESEVAAQKQDRLEAKQTEEAVDDAVGRYQVDQDATEHDP